MFLVTASLDNQQRAISSLCFSCAIAVLTYAVTSDITLQVPESELPENNDGNTIGSDREQLNNIVQSGTIASTDLFCEINGCKPKAALSFRYPTTAFA